VIAYTGLHMTAFIAGGVAAAWVVGLLESHPPAAIVLLLLFVGFEIAFFVFALGRAPRVIGVLGSAEVGVANLLAAGVMAAYFARRHPTAVRRLERLFER
jgi:hypothetical protein